MPEELRRVLDGALDGVSPPDSTGTGSTGTDSTADRLAAAGLAALRRSIEADSAARPDRQNAIDLLAADALLTYACEAAAEEGPEALDRFTGSLDFRRFEMLLEPNAP